MSRISRVRGALDVVTLAESRLRCIGPVGFSKSESMGSANLTVAVIGLIGCVIEVGYMLTVFDIVLTWTLRSGPR